MSVWKNHRILEKNSLLLTVGILLVVSIGGLVQIAPLFFVESTIERVQGVRPYSPLELAGRNIYIREGCYVCHSQMIRSLRDEVERYGPYSLAAESMYDHPFQWGSKRTGPDLARVGGKYSDEWHRAHLVNPRALVPTSIMPPYAFLEGREIDPSRIEADLQANRALGVPYDQAMLTNARADLLAQANPNAEGAEAVAQRYPRAAVRDFDGDPTKVTEMDALIAYLQMLGATVDRSSYDTEQAANLR